MTITEKLEISAYMDPRVQLKDIKSLRCEKPNGRWRCDVKERGKEKRSLGSFKIVKMDTMNCNVNLERTTMVIKPSREVRKDLDCNVVEMESKIVCSCGWQRPNYVEGR